MYGFCSSNAFYSVSLSFRTSILLLNPFDTDDCYYFGLNLNQVLPIKVLFIKTACNVVFKSSKNEKITLPHEFIFVFIEYFTGVILSGKSSQKRGVC